MFFDLLFRHLYTECGAEEIKEKERIRSREWARQNIDQQKRKEERQMSVAEIPCAICGKMFKPHDRSTTCSPECLAVLHRKNKQKYEQAHREERKARARERWAEKLAAMSEEERKAYREEVNRRGRENYRKRKERNTH